MPPKALTHPDGKVQIDELPNGKRRLTVHPTNAALFMPSGSCETAYPLDLIHAILAVKGLAYLCDEILRDENDAYVRLSLERDLRGYFDLAWFDGKRLLDFGSGAGASTMSLAKLFPQAEIVGIEVDQRLLALAQRRHQHYGFSHVTLMRSPSSLELPPGIGWFDCVVLSAVYEHMLPRERARLLPLIWSVISPGGFLFINQTPHRYFPYESHTTSLPFINYLPDALALAYARACSKRVRSDEPWESLLQDGIRGATEQEILGILSRDGAQEAVLLEPCREGLRDRIDLWYFALGKTRYRKTKWLLKGLLRAIRTLSGVTLVPNLSLIIRKDIRQPAHDLQPPSKRQVAHDEPDRFAVREPRR